MNQDWFHYFNCTRHFSLFFIKSQSLFPAEIELCFNHACSSVLFTHDSSCRTAFSASKLLTDRLLCGRLAENLSASIKCCVYLEVRVPAGGGQGGSDPRDGRTRRSSGVTAARSDGNANMLTARTLTSRYVQHAPHPVMLHQLGSWMTSPNALLV